MLIAPRWFSLGTPVFPSSQKPTFWIYYPTRQGTSLCGFAASRLLSSNYSLIYTVPCREPTCFEVGKLKSFFFLIDDNVKIIPSYHFSSFWVLIGSPTASIGRIWKFKIFNPILPSRRSLGSDTTYLNSSPDINLKPLIILTTLIWTPTISFISVESSIVCKWIVPIYWRSCHLVIKDNIFVGNTNSIKETGNDMGQKNCS